MQAYKIGYTNLNIICFKPDSEKWKIKINITHRMKLVIRQSFTTRDVTADSEAPVQESL